MSVETQLTLDETYDLLIEGSDRMRAAASYLRDAVDELDGVNFATCRVPEAFLGLGVVEDVRDAITHLGVLLRRADEENDRRRDQADAAAVPATAVDLWRVCLSDRAAADLHRRVSVGARPGDAAFVPQIVDAIRRRDRGEDPEVTLWLTDDELTTVADRLRPIGFGVEDDARDGGGKMIR